MIRSESGTDYEAEERDVLAWRKRIVDESTDTLSAEDIEACRAQRQKQEDFRRNDRVVVRK